MELQIEKMRKAREVIGEFPFEIVDLKQGYAGRTLRIDLDKNEMTIHPVTEEMKDLWIGGKGFGLWLMLQEIDKHTKWDSNNNPISMSSGPMGGTTSFPGSGKTIVTSISPMTNVVIDSNVGGYFGPFLKFTGFDALTIVGKAKDDVVVFIDSVNKKITIEKAPLEDLDSHILAEDLTEMYADDDMDRKNIAVVSAGRAANYTKMGILNFSFYDWRRKVARLKQAGRGGIGTVFRDKKIKALVLKNSRVNPAWTIEESKVAKFTTPKTLPKCDCKSELVDICKKWKNNPEYVIEMMQDVQERYRCIPQQAIDVINEMTGTEKAELYHIATFYKAFSLEERGETTVQVCMGTACHVKGAAKILDSFERVLEVKAGETTPDKKYSLEAVACLGACSIAPVVKIGDDVYGDVTASRAEALLVKSAEKAKGGE